jgi:hypothetical protein
MRWGNALPAPHSPTRATNLRASLASSARSRKASAKLFTCLGKHRIASSAIMTQCPIMSLIEPSEAQVLGGNPTVLTQ